MKLVTFTLSDSVDHRRYRIGSLVSNQEILDLTHFASGEALSAAEVLNCLDLESDFLTRAADADQASLQRHDRSSIRICAPVPRPGKIICIGLNYRDHAEESGMEIPKSPIIFSKFSTCAIGPNDPIVLPQGSTQTDYEAELAFVIG